MSRITPLDMQTALDAVSTSINTRGYAPSRREVAASIDRNSVATAQTVLRRLEEEGFIEIDDRISRGIRLTSAGMQAITERI